MLGLLSENANVRIDKGGEMRMEKPITNERSDKSQPCAVPALDHEQLRIHKWFTQVKFRKRMFGGVDEADLWKKLLELNALFDAALSAERARYDALLEEQEKKDPSAWMGGDRI